MNDKAVQAFSSTAATYDHQRARLVPGYAELYRWAVFLLPAEVHDVLDLGAGTGLLAAWVRERFPAAALHLVDASEAMLSQAKERFAEDPHVTFQLADYATTNLEGAYDAVVSALSIHHLADKDKRTLFRNVRMLLRPGGVFLNAEQVLGPTPALEESYRQTWLEEVRSLGATEQQIRDSLFRQEGDRCATVEDQLLWLREAGFTDVDCWFKRGRFATMAARQPNDAESGEALVGDRTV